MTSDCPEGRWPFGIDGRRLTGGVYDPAANSATVTFVSAAADALDTDTSALPPLNDRIDPDCIERLLADVPTDPPAGVRVAVEVSYRDISVSLRDDGGVEVYPNRRDPDESKPSLAVEHDWRGATPLFWSIGEAVAEAADERPTDVATRLVERIDADAANRLLRPLFDRSERVESRLLLSVDGCEVVVTPDGSITVEPSLAALKRSGAAVLVVGSVPESGFDRASATLLGGPDEGRSPVFVLHGRNLETASRRLSMAGMSPAAATVLDYRAEARGASVAATGDVRPADRQPTVVPVERGSRALREAVRRTVSDARTVRPGEFRISVDSLSSMIESNGLETTRGEIESLCRIVRERGGIGNFLFPADAASEEVETLAPSFDAVVELRAGDVGVEQRWRLTGTGHETSWFPLG